MNTSILQIKKSAVFIFIALLLGIADTAFAQSDSSWQAIGFDTVFTNKHVEINNTLDVHGKPTAENF